MDSQKIKHKAQIVAGISITLVGFYLIMYLPA